MNAAPRQRRALWALALIAAAGAASALAFWRMGAPRDAFQPMGPALPGFAVHAADIKQYVITTPDGAYRLARGDVRWVVMERSGYPAAPAKIEALSAGLAGLKLTRVITRDPKKFDALSLSDPREGGKGVLIVALDERGAERASLLIGASAQGLAARRPGSLEAYAAQGSLPRLSGPMDFTDLDALRLAPERVRSIAITTPLGAQIHLERAAPNAPFALAQRAQPELANAPPLDRIALALSPFQPDDVREIVNSESDSGNKLVGERRIVTFDGLEVRVIFTQKLDSSGRPVLWAAAAAAAAGGGGSASEAVAINTRASGWAFAFPISDLGALFPSLDPSKSLQTTEKITISRVKPNPAPSTDQQANQQEAAFE